MFWKKKKKPAPTPTPADFRLAHHYTFAHFILPQMLATVPGTMMLQKAYESCEGLAEIMWSHTCQQCANVQTHLTARDFEAVLIKLNEQPAIYIKMPPARNPAEAFCVAIIYEKGVADMDVKTVPYTNFRYFTFEAGLNGRAVVGEWRNGSHLNFGEVEENSSHAFMQKIEALLAKDEAPDAMLVYPSQDEDDESDASGMPNELEKLLKPQMVEAGKRLANGETPDAIKASFIADGLDEAIATMAVELAALAKKSIDEELKGFI